MQQLKIHIHFEVKKKKLHIHYCQLKVAIKYEKKLSL